MGTPKPLLQRLLGRDFLPAGLMGGPAFLGITVFLLIPFVFGIYFSFTNRRLLSPEPTQWVGLRNYDRLLALSTLTLEPERDDTTGAILRDADGNIQYPRSRSITRNNPKYEGFTELKVFDLNQKRYILLAKDPIFYRSLFNTITFAVMVLPLQLGLALGMALLVNQKIPGVNIFRTIYFSPVVTSMVVVSIIWTYLYNKDVGLMNNMLDSVTFGLWKPLNWLGDSGTAMIAIVIMSAWQGMGLQMVIFLAGLQGIPENLYEAAGIDGANSWQKFRNVTLPSLRNTFVFIIIATTIAAFALFVQVNVMTQGGPNDATTTVMYHVYTKGFREQNIGYGSAISVVYFVFILAIALVQRRVLTERKAK
jgi:multiple sugar transport system permease protein